MHSLNSYIRSKNVKLPDETVDRSFMRIASRGVTSWRFMSTAGLGFEVSSTPCTESERYMNIELLAEKHKTPVSRFWVDKYANEARRNWDLFYKRNETNFFKDRHYLEKEFPLLSDSSCFRSILEVGCGVGNALLPLVARNPHLKLYGVDFSPRAIDFIKNDPVYCKAEGRAEVFVCDITNEDLPLAEHVDAAIMLFVLSAIPPGKMGVVFKKVANSLKPGGQLFFRDYGIYDMSQLRLRPGSQLSDKFYVRQQDGTMTYFFEKEEIEALGRNAGLEVQSCHYYKKTIVNRKRDVEMKRVWIQAIFTKPD